jgi:hypothetical protein
MVNVPLNNHRVVPYRLKSVGTGTNAGVDILFFNHLATALIDAALSNSIDSWEDLGHYETRDARDLGSRT